MTDEQLKKIEYLNRAFNLENYISRLKKRKNINKTLSSPNYKSDGTQHKGGYNREEERVMKILELDSKITVAKSKLETAKQEIKQAIESVSDDELRELLECRYIDYMKMKDIAEVMNCDERTAKRKHKKALDKVVIACHPFNML